jgi:hypothetical protein
MSPDELERRLRRVGEALPEPDAATTRRARGRALSALGSGRRRAPLALAAALLAACAVGIALGATVVSSGRAADAAGFGFLPATGWNVVGTGGAPSPAHPVQAIAANVRLSPEDDPNGLPYSTLLSLPPHGVVVVASSAGRREELGTPADTLHLPLRLRDASPVQFGAQLRPGRPLAQYELRGIVNGEELIVTIYFGTARPSQTVLAATQRQLDRLVVVSQPPDADVAARALPLRRAGGGSARVLDRTLSCPTEASGGVREIEVRVHTGFRQGGKFVTLPFAVVASGGVRSVIDVLDDSLVWAAAGKYDHNANLTPSEGGVALNVTRFGTWAANRAECRTVRETVPLSAKGLRAVPTDPLGVTYDCQAQRRVLVRVRAVAHAAPSRYREEQFEKTKASLQEAAVAVRTIGGKQLAFASVADSGRARLLVSTACRED